jgi:hypothetical protein
VIWKAGRQAVTYLADSRKPKPNLAVKKSRSTSDLLDRVSQNLSSGFTSNPGQDKGVQMSYKQENRLNSI